MAEKMLTNWFAFLLHKFLKVSGSETGAAVESKMRGCSSEPGHRGCVGSPSGAGPCPAGVLHSKAGRGV